MMNRLVLEYLYKENDEQKLAQLDFDLNVLYVPNIFLTFKIGDYIQKEFDADYFFFSRKTTIFYINYIFFSLKNCCCSGSRETFVIFLEATNLALSQLQVTLNLQIQNELVFLLTNYDYNIVTIKYIIHMHFFFGTFFRMLERHLSIMICHQVINCDHEI